jgi:hypothetical protein
MVLEKNAPKLWENVKVSAVIDLEVLCPCRSLGTTLMDLEIGKEVKRELHCAGNDANYTLRAVLLCTVHNFLKDKNETGDGQMVERVREVALGGIPDPNQDQDDSPKKRKRGDGRRGKGSRERRREKRAENFGKSGDIPKQGLIQRRLEKSKVHADYSLDNMAEGWGGFLFGDVEEGEGNEEKGEDRQ